MNSKFDNTEYRNAWLSGHIKQLLSAQFRALRGKQLQADFGERIGRSQSNVARYESPSYGNLTINTLLDVAQKLCLGLQIRFVPFSQTVEDAKNLSPDDLAPLDYETDKKARRAIVSGLTSLGGISPKLDFGDGTGSGRDIHNGSQTGSETQVTQAVH